MGQATLLDIIVHTFRPCLPWSPTPFDGRDFLLSDSFDAGCGRRTFYMSKPSETSATKDCSDVVNAKLNNITAVLLLS